MTKEIQKLYNPKTAFGNVLLLSEIEEEKVEEERRKLILECKFCDDYGDRSVECENCEGRGNFLETCNHKENQNE